MANVSSWQQPTSHASSERNPSSNTLISSSSSSPHGSSEGGLNRPPSSQHIIIPRPQWKETHHEPNPDKDETRRIQVYSKSEEKFTDVSATFITDMNENWISRGLVKHLDPTWRAGPRSKLDCGRLGKKVFHFLGRKELQFLENGKSKYADCRVVPGNSFEVYLQYALLPAASPRERMLNVLEFPSAPPTATSNESPLPTTSPLTAVAGSFDGLPEAIGDNSKESLAADGWMQLLKADVHKWIEKPANYLRDTPVKIAVLDTGVDSKHNFIRGAVNTNRIKDRQSFVKGDKSTEDSFGHGTHVAALLLEVAPDAQIYVAKVANTGDIPTDHNIADAIKWATELDVDIITMSFGLERDHDDMTEAILQAHSKRIIMFAAASNNGGNQDVTFPARMNEVICIYSTDGKGNASDCNPTEVKDSGYHFATLGEAVRSAWPKHLQGSQTYKRMTGTSFSTPIAAAVAACILEFARMHKIDNDLYKLLRSCQGMQLIFANHLADKRGKLHYIHPWKLFASHRTAGKILTLIQDPLERRIGRAAKVEDEVCD